MKTLSCDIGLPGQQGFTTNFLLYQLDNFSETTAIQNISSALLYRAKTKPAKYATRCASLVGVAMSITDETTKDQVIDLVIDGIKYANNQLRKKVNT